MNKDKSEAHLGEAANVQPHDDDDDDGRLTLLAATHCAPLHPQMEEPQSGCQSQPVQLYLAEISINHQHHFTHTCLLKKI